MLKAIMFVICCIGLILLVRFINTTGHPSIAIGVGFFGFGGLINYFLDGTGTGTGGGGGGGCAGTPGCM